MADDLSQKGTLTKLWQNHGKAVKWLSLGGLLLTCCFLPTAAVAAPAGSGLAGIAAQFYGTAASAASTNFIPGWGNIFEAAFDDAVSIGETIMDAAP